MTATKYVAAKGGRVYEEFDDPDETVAVVGRMRKRFPADNFVVAPEKEFLSRRWELPVAWDVEALESLIYLMIDCREQNGNKMTESQKGEMRQCIMTLHDVKGTAPVHATLSLASSMGNLAAARDLSNR